MRTCKIIFLNTEYLNTSSKRVGGNLFTHATSEAVSTKSIHRVSEWARNEQSSIQYIGSVEVSSRYEVRDPSDKLLVLLLQTTFRAPTSAAPRTCAKNYFTEIKALAKFLLQSVAICCSLLHFVGKAKIDVVPL